MGGFQKEKEIECTEKGPWPVLFILFTVSFLYIEKHICRWSLNIAIDQKYIKQAPKSLTGNHIT